MLGVLSLPAGLTQRGDGTGDPARMEKGCHGILIDTRLNLAGEASCLVETLKELMSQASQSPSRAGVFGAMGSVAR